MANIHISEFDNAVTIAADSSKNCFKMAGLMIRSQTPMNQVLYQNECHRYFTFTRYRHSTIYFSALYTWFQVNHSSGCIASNSMNCQYSFIVFRASRCFSLRGHPSTDLLNPSSGFEPSDPQKFIKPSACNPVDIFAAISTGNKFDSRANRPPSALTLCTRTTSALLEVLTLELFR